MTGPPREGVTGPVGTRGQTTRRDAPPSPGTPQPAGTQLARELLDGLADAVLTTDGTGVVTFVNARTAELLPEIVPGTDLSASALPALAAAETFDAEHRGRRLRGVRRCLTGGRYAWYVRDVSEEYARTTALLAERSRTAFLTRAGSRLGMSLHRDHALRTAVTLAVPHLADLALVVHRPPAPTEHLPHWLRYADGDPAPVAGVAPWAVTSALPGLPEAFAGDTSDPGPWPDADLTDLLPAGFGRPGAVLVSPVLAAGRPAGALVLVRRVTTFDPRDVEVAREFAARAGAALATADLYGEKAHLARVLQASLLPPELPAVPGIALAGGYRAAGDTLRIGGDFYEVFPTARGALFTLGDVCGKGVGAAVLTGRVRQSLQTLRLVEQRPAELVRLLDRALLHTPDAARRSQFTTVLLGTLDREPDGGVRATIAGGGHPSPLLVRPDGTVEPVPVGGMPVGALAAARFGRATVRLAPGELLLAYSDGVIEARGGPRDVEMFGEGRLRRALASAVGLPPAALVDRLLQLVDEWLGGQSQDDDITMLAMSASPG
ncbi:PP2C family protein-serine/threonine phosphatase [Micromonospora sp. WMMD558]|uniref:PP2C family protein-serine/threonine phosphatase n=1 Tax=unclassified Micromonospora TaxID=2617518 RepID=UPI001E61C60E|nr:PP2C family protein-serine/threonine phosphatase [Micromonospora sp. WMMC415]